MRAIGGRPRKHDKVRAFILRVASTLFSNRTWWCGYRIEVDKLKAGEVRLAMSVLYAASDTFASQHHPGYGRQMGILDSLIPGRGPRYKESPISLEGALGAWAAARTKGGLSLAGGVVVLTPEHLVFSPWNMDQTRKWLVTWLGKAGVPQAGSVDRLLDGTKLLEPVAIPVSEITGLEQRNRASLFRPPTARIELRGGNQMELGILASPTKPNLSPSNDSAFDDFMARTSQVLAVG